MRSTLASVVAIVALPLLVSACSSPLHLSYDYGRAYTQAFTAQPDLTRPAAANAAYGLQGVEASRIRMNVERTTARGQTTATATLN